jgi:glutamine synthetase type III
MADDEVIGDGGNVTVYQRPDRSQYALDKRGALLVADDVWPLPKYREMLFPV